MLSVVAAAEIFNLFSMLFLALSLEELEIKNKKLKTAIVIIGYISIPIVMLWAMFWGLPQTALTAFIVGIANIAAIAGAIYLKFIK